MGALRGQEAAIKCVRVEQESHYRTFVREVGALTRMRHPNVMRLLGKHGYDHMNMENSTRMFFLCYVIS